MEIENIMEIDGTPLMLLKAPNKYVWKAQQQCLIFRNHNPFPILLHSKHFFPY